MAQKPGTGITAHPDFRTAAITAHHDARMAARTQRLGPIKAIANDRKSVVLGYVTASRGTIGAQVGMDVIRLFPEP
jgi:hypothetical protein